MSTAQEFPERCWSGPRVLRPAAFRWPRKRRRARRRACPVMVQGASASRPWTYTRNCFFQGRNRPDGRTRAQGGAAARQGRARAFHRRPEAASERGWTRMAIDMEILSINPFWYRPGPRYGLRRSPRSTTRKLARACAPPSQTASAPSHRSRLQFPDLGRDAA